MDPYTLCRSALSQKIAYGTLRKAYGTLRNPRDATHYLKFSLRNLTESLRNLTEFERFAGFSKIIDPRPLPTRPGPQNRYFLKGM